MRGKGDDFGSPFSVEYLRGAKKLGELKRAPCNEEVRNRDCSQTSAEATCGKTQVTRIGGGAGGGGFAGGTFA